MFQIGDKVRYGYHPEVATIYRVSPKGRNIYLKWDEFRCGEKMGPYSKYSLHLAIDPNDILKGML